MRSRTPLILLPGMLCDGVLWRHQTEALSDIAEPAVADLGRHDSIHAMALSVLAAAPGTFALAGLSMGGYVAQEIMRLAPQRVERLALLDTSAHADAPGQSDKRRAYIEQCGRGDFKGITLRLLPMLIHSDRLDDAILCETVMNMAASVGREVFIRQQMALMTRAEGVRDLGRIQCPTLVLCGREDALTPLDEHREMARFIPNATLVVVGDCGHLPPLERPDEVNKAMREWLEER